MRRLLGVLCLGAVLGCTTTTSPNYTQSLRKDLQRLRASPAPSSSPSRGLRRHRVARGETLYSIARRYGVTVDELKRANGLSSNTILVGRELRVPASTRPAVSDPAPGRPPASERGFRWPVPASRHSRPDGDALVIYAPEGAEVVAAAPGRVSYVSQQLRGQGAAVMLEHGNGLITYYGRLSRSLVRLGQQVGRGDVVGRVGPGGSMVGPRLRFMVFRNGRTVPAAKQVTP